jgi:UPF0755 protein
MTRLVRLSAMVPNKKSRKIMAAKRSIVSTLAMVFAVIAMALLLVAQYGWMHYKTWLVTPLTIPTSEYHYELEKGKSISHVAYDLAEKGVLAQPRWLIGYARYQQAEKIHAGEYFLEVGITPEKLLEKLTNGDVVLHQVTFLEGWNFQQIVAALNEKPEIKHKLQNKTSAEQLAILNLPITHPEGWFYPDTYTFSKGTSDVDLLIKAYKNTRKILDELWTKKAPNLPYKNDYEALIMASIIERETGAASEREQIAGVFVRRLQQGMRLQTDPTVIYGMGEAYKGKIGRDNLKQSTAYNTYVIVGLPPTPIAAPSKASLHAALHPAEGKALYFVAKGDGTSEFSETLVQHQRAVVRYQLKRRDDYRSAPHRSAPQ